MVRKTITQPAPERAETPIREEPPAVWCDECNEYECPRCFDFGSEYEFEADAHTHRGQKLPPAPLTGAEEAKGFYLRLPVDRFRALVGSEGVAKWVEERQAQRRRIMARRRRRP